jgi:hypothetical protein
LHAARRHEEQDGGAALVACLENHAAVIRGVAANVVANPNRRRDGGGLGILELEGDVEELLVVGRVGC